MTTATTFLPLAPAQAFAGFRKTAAQFECPVSEEDDSLEITLEVARIFLSAQGEGTKLLLEASDNSKLQMMRDVLTEQLKGYGLTPDWDGITAMTRPANQTFVTIEKAERLSPSYMRVTMSGAQLARFGTGGFHFRLLFGPEGAGVFQGSCRLIICHAARFSFCSMGPPPPALWESASPAPWTLRSTSGRSGLSLT